MKFVDKKEQLVFEILATFSIYIHILIAMQFLVDKSLYQKKFCTLNLYISFAVMYGYREDRQGFHRCKLSK